MSFSARFVPRPPSAPAAHRNRSPATTAAGAHSTRATRPPQSNQDGYLSRVADAYFERPREVAPVSSLSIGVAQLVFGTPQPLRMDSNCMIDFPARLAQPPVIVTRRAANSLSRPNSAYTPARRAAVLMQLHSNDLSRDFHRTSGLTHQIVTARANQFEERRLEQVEAERTLVAMELELKKDSNALQAERHADALESTRHSAHRTTELLEEVSQRMLWNEQRSEILQSQRDAEQHERMEVEDRLHVVATEKERVEESKQQLEDELLTTSDVMRNAARHHRELRAHVDANLAPSIHLLQQEVSSLRHLVLVSRKREEELEQEKLRLLQQKAEERQAKQRFKQEAEDASAKVENLQAKLSASELAHSSLQSTHTTLLASAEHLRSHTTSLEIRHHALEESFVTVQEKLQRLQGKEREWEREWKEKVQRVEDQAKEKQEEANKERSEKEQSLQREEQLQQTISSQSKHIQSCEITVASLRQQLEEMNTAFRNVTAQAKLKLDAAETKAETHHAAWLTANAQLAARTADLDAAIVRQTALKNRLAEAEAEDDHPASMSSSSTAAGQRDLNQQHSAKSIAGQVATVQKEMEKRVRLSEEGCLSTLSSSSASAQALTSSVLVQSAKPATLRLLLTSATSAVDALTARLTRAEQTEATLRSSLTLVQAERTVQQRHREEVQRAMGTVKMELTQAKSEAEKQRTRHASELSALAASLSSSQASFSSLETLHASTNELLQGVRNELKRQVEEGKKGKDQMAREAKEREEALAGELASTKSQLSERTARWLECMEREKTADEKLSRLLEHHEALIKATSIERTSLQAALSTLEKRQYNTNLQLRSTQLQVAGLRMRVTQREKQIAALNETISNLNSTAAALKVLTDETSHREKQRRLTALTQVRLVTDQLHGLQLEMAAKRVEMDEVKEEGTRRLHGVHTELAARRIEIVQLKDQLKFFKMQLQQAGISAQPPAETTVQPPKPSHEMRSSPWQHIEPSADPFAQSANRRSSLPSSFHAVGRKQPPLDEGNTALTTAPATIPPASGTGSMLTEPATSPADPLSPLIATSTVPLDIPTEPARGRTRRSTHQPHVEGARREQAVTSRPHVHRETSAITGVLLP